VLQEVLAQIKTRPFKATDLKLLHEMLETQSFKDISKITKRSLPKIGYICLLGDQPLAAGFLRRVESDIVAQIDGLTSNRNFGSILRHQAISEIVTLLINDAKALKIQGLIAFTKDNGVLDRAKDLGFVKHSESFISLTITHI
jgi:hypothetical protein